MKTTKTQKPKAFKMIQASVLTVCMVTGFFALGVATNGKLNTVGMLGATIPDDAVRQAKKMQLEEKIPTIEAAREIIAISAEDRLPTAEEIKLYDFNGDEKLTDKDVDYIIKNIPTYE
jgi:hypothetical protein